MTPTRRKTLLRTIAGNTAKAALLIGSSMLILFLADRTLQLLGYTDRHGFHIAHLPNIRATVDNLEYSYDVATNSQGLRYKEIPFEKDDNEYRFIVLGDSFVEGTGVEAGDTFAALLEQQYSRAGHIVRFINAGLAGTGPHDYLRLFHFIGRKYQPDAVLIALFANDAADSKPAALSGLRTSGCITDFVQKTCLL
ncbi:MAG TPA: hypothetical protein PLP17_16455, partial [Oligoflexia bacterium]|nr:hypothetical protein [Oligoflexia bacterium]